ncbi:hypothetical protein H072_6731 [Dactylellina haptotyla CBS 200.50]|uniref:glucan 1,4-alpha-glucosidase n=1 Tax=Dactylellina haptotyla (strain CBS 200.50) TaxID=1284197 RepID=S8AED2_DACHA|nr:hypothetical protein H072_6731 [Dactylellina haptotyla CBS 200.50]
MRFNFSSVVGALCLFLTVADAAAIQKRSTQVWIQRWFYRDSTLAGLVKVQSNLGRSKRVEVWYGSGDSWQRSPIVAIYSSGPDRNGYEDWIFNGWALQATKFYVKYIVNGVQYLDPAPGYYYPITDGKAGSAPVPTSKLEARAELEAWLSQEYDFAEAALKKNIGSSSNTNLGKGVVIASPSTSQPDYFFQWIRDASCVMEHIVGNYLESGQDLDYIIDWVEVQKTLQRLDNPSGGYTTGGLGEPKFKVDNTAYTDSWGRPQRDGPALRASTLMRFATQYLSKDADYVKSKLYDSAAQGQSQTIIKADLDYVVTSWSQSSFDLWEEIQGQHYFTIIVSYRSMVEGAEFAKLMGDNAAADLYTKTAESMIDTIKGFWQPDKGYIVETHGIQGRSGLDCGVLLGALRAPYIFTPAGEEVLATTEAMISAFEPLYGINKNNGGPGFGIGRYPEDTYDGVSTSSQGNPWFICTATVAHTLYAAAADFKSANSVNVTPASLNLFKRAFPSANPGTYSSGSQEFNNIVNGFKTLGDGFMAVIQRHAFQDGRMSEQFDRNTGFNMGARDLTWSYEAVLEAIKARGRL